MVLREKYRLDAVLGVGGMAAVYAATHRNKKRFAIKILHPEVSAHAEIRSRFLREGYVANSVGHPGAVAVLDDDEAEDGSAFLVMELLEGASCDTIWERSGRHVALRAALGIVHQLLDVLAAAHDHGIVHRDIKPSNLFLLPDGQLKVLDFGIARLRDAATSGLATAIGTTLGTPAFMAPEQALAQTSDIDARSDIWSVGATLFTLISGQFVHPGDNEAQVLVRAATQRARSLAEVQPETPAAVVELVARALAFEREERWQSARSMRDAVARIHAEMFGEGPSKALLAAPHELLRPLSSAPPTSGPTSRTMTAQHRAALPSADRAMPERRRVPAVAAAVALLGALAAATLIRLRSTGSSENGTTSSASAGAVLAAPALAEQPPPAPSVSVDPIEPKERLPPAIAATTATVVSSAAPIVTPRRTPFPAPSRSDRTVGATTAAIAPHPSAAPAAPAASAPHSPLDMHLQ
jgi:serine/threonine-protein kinase